MQLRTQGAVLGAAVLAVAALLAGRLAYHPGSRPGGPPASDAAQTFPDLNQTYWPPGAADRAVIARMYAKQGIADEVIAGRLSLLQAAAAFRDLDAQDPRNPTAELLWVFPESSSADEAYCRSVISHVKYRVPPDRAEQLTSGLEAELAARLRGGTLRLPEP